MVNSTKKSLDCRGWMDKKKHEKQKTFLDSEGWSCWISPKATWERQRFGRRRATRGKPLRPDKMGENWSQWKDGKGLFQERKHRNVIEAKCVYTLLYMYIYVKIIHSMCNNMKHYHSRKCMKQIILRKDIVYDWYIMYILPVQLEATSTHYLQESQRTAFIVCIYIYIYLGIQYLLSSEREWILKNCRNYILSWCYHFL